MGTQYAGADGTYPVDFTIPDDGDARNASSVNVAFQALGDRTAIMRAALAPLATFAALTAILAPTDGLVRHVEGHGLYIFRTASTTAGPSPFWFAADDLTVGGWTSSTAHETARTGRVRLSQIPIFITPTAVGLGTNTDFGPVTAAQVYQRAFGFQTRVVDVAGSNYQFNIPLDDGLIDGATIVFATLFCRPANSHVGLPTRQISISLERSAHTGSGGAALSNPTKLKSGATGHTALASASVAAYQADQQLVITPDQNNIIDLSLYSYCAVIADEGGTNALSGACFSKIELALTGIVDAGRRR